MVSICTILEAIRYNDVVLEAMTQIPRIYNYSYAQCLLIMKEKIQIQTWKLDTEQESQYIPKKQLTPA
jgi:hypothetical protein